jgi:hypothetical protein
MATEAVIETVKLIRKPVEAAGLKTLTEETLMAEIKDVLGYGEVDKAVELRKVAAILRELDIEPFESKRVEAYKKAEAKKLNKTSRRYRDYNSYTTTTRGVWKSTALRNYKREVPAFALLRASQIKKAMNAQSVNCDFIVEELGKTRQTIVVDPFMVLVAAGKKFYIDVWNEPKFEGRRTK